MRKLGERLAVAEIILHELSRSSMHRADLERRVFKRDIGRSSFDGMFAFLVSDGDIQKAGLECRAPFRLTEKGQRFLAWRSKC
jgi:DNA-binding PadR family transcriptional regulator